MNPLRSFAPGSAHRQRVLNRSLLILIALLPFLPLTMAVESGCTSAQDAEVKAAGAAVLKDAQSPEGQQLLGDVSSAALQAGLDAATGNDAGAIVAGIQGGVSLFRDYEGMKTAPSAATLTQAIAVGSGVPTVAKQVAPAVTQIVTKAAATAKKKGITVKLDDLMEAAARGLDAVATAKYVPLVTSTSTGEAP